MVIELHYTDEELTTLLNGLNNAILAIENVYNALRFGCEVPENLRQLTLWSYDEIYKYTAFRLAALKDLYQYLLTYERA